MPRQTPPLRFLVRERITSALASAVAERPLVLLAAPAAYGKSTAALDLAKALSARTDSRVYRLSMTAGAENPDAFWARAAGQLAAQGAPIAERMRGTAFPATRDAVRSFIDEAREILLRRHAESASSRNLSASFLPASSVRTVLMVDDYHAVQVPVLDAFLETLAREELPGLSLLVISRARLPLPMEELAVKGLAAQFGPDLLAFSRDDALRFFRLHDRNNSAAALKAWEICAGWPGALRACLEHPLFAGAPAEEGPGSEPSAFMETPAYEQAMPHTVEDLLGQSVLDRMDTEDQCFLSRLCVLEGFTPPQAAYVSGDPGALVRLKKIYERNAFLDRDSRGRYRLHPLLRVFLRRRLDAVHAASAGAEHFSGEGPPTPLLPDISPAVLFRRAGELHLGRGDTLSAIKAFAKAGQDEDYDRILSIFERQGEEYSLALDPGGVSSVVLSIPWCLRRKRPFGYLGFLYQYCTCVDAEKGSDLLRRAELDFFTPGNVDAAVLPRMAGEIAHIRSALAFGDLRETTSAWREAYGLLQGPSRMARSGHAWLQSSPHAGLIYHHVPGGYEETVSLCAEALPDYLALTGGAGAGADLLMRAEWLLETGRLGAVNVKALQAEYAARSTGQTAVRIGIAFTRARLALAMETEDNPVSLISELAPKAHASRNPMLVASLDLSLGYVLALMGKTRRIPAWLQRGEMDPAKTMRQGMGMEYVVHGKALLALGRYRHLADFTAVMEDIFQPAPCLFGRMHTYCLHAAAVARQHDPETAAAVLKKALDLGRPDGLLLLFAEYGEHIMPALEILRRQAALARPAGTKRPRAKTSPAHHTLSEETHIATVLSLARKYIRRSVPGGGAPAHANGAGIISGKMERLKGLTSRGREALHLASQGKTNPQIAASLGIKPVTVGKILMAVYRTLDVKNRVEAVNLWQKGMGSGEG